MSEERSDRGPVFDGVRIGRPATGALLDADYRTLADLPDDLGELATLQASGRAPSSGCGRRAS